MLTLTRKPVIYTIIMALMVPTFVLGFRVHSGCACLGPEQILYDQAMGVITQSKNSRGSYPTYEEVVAGVKLKTELGPVGRYEGTKPADAGVYYSVTPNGDSYMLKHYADVSFFGVKLPVLWEVK